MQFFLFLPVALEGGGVSLQLFKLIGELPQPLLRMGVLFSQESLLFNLSWMILLSISSSSIGIESISILIHVRFIYKIDCLIRQEPVSDIAVGKNSCGNDRCP